MNYVERINVVIVVSTYGSIEPVIIRLKLDADTLTFRH